MTTTETRPTVAAVAAEVAQLRSELAALRSELSEEVCTRRLVVVDEAGIERITTTCTAERTMLCISIVDVTDDLGVGHQTDATAYIAAELDRTGALDGNPQAIAQVQCTTGDDAFAILRQRSIVGECRGRRTVVNRGEVLLHQQRWEACYRDGAMNTEPLSVVEVGPDGVVERDVSGDLISHAPMRRFVR